MPKIRSEQKKEDIYLACPFCKENDFDLPGLKSHLSHGDCAVYNDTENFERLF